MRVFGLPKCYRAPDIVQDLREETFKDGGDVKKPSKSFWAGGLTSETRRRAS